jgi:hypothetical protein
MAGTVFLCIAHILESYGGLALLSTKTFGMRRSYVCNGDRIDHLAGHSLLPGSNHSYKRIQSGIITLSFLLGAIPFVTLS